MIFNKLINNQVPYINITTDSIVKNQNGLTSKAVADLQKKLDTLQKGQCLKVVACDQSTNLYVTERKHAPNDHAKALEITVELGMPWGMLQELTVDALVLTGADELIELDLTCMKPFSELHIKGNHSRLTDIRVPKDTLIFVKPKPDVQYSDGTFSTEQRIRIEYCEFKSRGEPQTDYRKVNSRVEWLTGENLAEFVEFELNSQQYVPGANDHFDFNSEADSVSFIKSVNSSDPENSSDLDFFTPTQVYTQVYGLHSDKNAIGEVHLGSFEKEEKKEEKK
jgi:hypothetical protein